MPDVHVVAPNLAPGDAIAQDALGMVRALREHGYPAFLYSDEIDPTFGEASESLDDYEARAGNSSEDVLIYHHAVGWQPGLELYRRSRNRRILKFHNITPPDFYEGIRQEYVNSCSCRLAQSRELVPYPAERWLGASNFN